MNKPTKPTNLMPRSFGGVKNNFSANLQNNGFEDGVPTIYGGDNLNYQLDATGKELDYCEKICDFINALPIGQTITTDNNNKLVYTEKVSKSGDTMTGVLNIDTGEVNSLALSGIDGTTIQQKNIRFNRTGSGHVAVISGRYNGLVNTLNLSAYDSNDNPQIGISVNCDSNDNVYTFALTPASGDNSTKIATTEFVNGAISDDTLHVKKSGDTMTGALIITGASESMVQPVTKGTSPSSNANWQLIFRDSAGTGAANRLGELRTTYDTTGNVYTRLYAYAPINGSSSSSYIGIGYNNGDPYTYAPASNVANSILTTVSSEFSSRGYVKLGNGLIIQWGRDSQTITLSAGSASNAYTITYPTAFSTAGGHVVTATAVAPGVYISTGNIGAGTSTQTQFTYRFNATVSQTNETVVMNWIAIGY